MLSCNIGNDPIKRQSERYIIMENKFEDLKVYVNEKLITQDAKLKEICSSLLEEVKEETMKKVKIHKVRIKKLE